MNHLPRARQRGATLIITLVMLVMLTLILVSAGTLSFTNLKIVGNMQFRSEALGAANLAIEEVISNDFTLAAQTQTVSIDVNQDGTADYSVTVVPQCIGSRTVPTNELVMPADFGCVLGQSGSPLGSSGGSSLCADTKWELRATVTDANSGATVTMHQGVSKRMSVTLASNSC